MYQKLSGQKICCLFIQVVVEVEHYQSWKHIVRLTSINISSTNIKLQS